MKKHKSTDIMVQLTAYLTLASVTIATLVGMPINLKFWITLGIFVLITLEMTLFDWFVTSQKATLYILIVIVTTSPLFFVGVSPGLYLIIFFIISAQAMMLLPMRWGIFWIIVMAAISSVSFIAVEGLQTGLLTMLVYGGGYLFFGVFGKALMDANRAQEESQELYQELQEVHAQLQDYVYRVEELAATKERNRLAREMHDSLGHRMTVASVQLEGAQRLIPTNPEKAAEMVGTVREQVRQSLADLRQLVAALRQPIEADLSINQSLERLVQGFEEITRLDIQLNIGELPELPPTYRHTIYRTVQEALTNIEKHAQATQIWVTLTMSEDKLSLTIADNGIGFPDQDEMTGFGLRGLKERVALIGGECYFESRAGGGAQISVLLPPFEENSHE